METLAAAGFSKRFGAIDALRSVSLEVRRGDVVALIGPNGSGKTTLLDALAGMLDVDGGGLTSTRGRVSRADRPRELFYLPDGVHPWPDQRVGWVLAWCEGVFGGTGRNRESLIERLSLGGHLAARLGTLSKGEHRRVMLAIALNTPQPFLLLDEPFDGLDLRQTREVMTLLREHAAGGRGILVSIHQLNDAARVADRLVLLDRGVVVASGTLDELRGRAARPDASLEDVFLALGVNPASIGRLMVKDARELLASRAFWLLMVVVSLLVGHAFMTAADTFAELSGAAGGMPVLAQGLNPLDGIVRPTFGAYTLAVTLLLPFVAIRLIANERESGAMRLLVQAPASRARIVASKLIVLKLAWITAMLPGFGALAIWRLAGGHLYLPEVLSVVVGHIVIGVIAISVALAAGAMAGSPASAAILALAFTLGTWAIDFAATVQGGWVTSLARYTPAALLRAFENGEVRLSSLAIASLIALLGGRLAAIAIDEGEKRSRRMTSSVIAVVIAAAAAVAFSFIHVSADVSEDRRTSFPEAHERALRGIGKPLTLDANLGPEDPRRFDLEREILAKLERVMDVRVRYVGASTTGLTSRSEHYGEMVYSIGGRADTTRSVIEPVVLELIYRLADVPPPAGPNEEAAYPGYPLPRVPRGSAFIFVVLWPAAIVGAWLVARRRL